MVHDQVHDQLHAALMDRGKKLVEVGERPEDRVDVLVVADVVAVVIHRRAEHRRQPDDIHTEALDVIQPR